MLKIPSLTFFSNTTKKMNEETQEKNNENNETHETTMSPFTGFQDNKLAGKSMVADFKNIQNVKLLNNPAEITKLCKKICSDHQFTILEESQHIFKPQGFTLCFILSESHFIVHTYPERQFLSLDLYTCRQYKNNETYENIFIFLVSELQACYDTSIIYITNRYFNAPNRNIIIS
jgi:S-adenosylmethionine/arginine decarboxylase-like enzyme